MTDYIQGEIETDNLVDAQAKASALPEISTAEAVAVCTRLLTEHEAALLPTDAQKVRIFERITAEASQCECEQIGVRKCGQCDG